MPEQGCESLLETSVLKNSERYGRIRRLVVRTVKKIGVEIDFGIR